VSRATKCPAFPAWCNIAAAMATTKGFLQVYYAKPTIIAAFVYCNFVMAHYVIPLVNYGTPEI